MKDADGDDGAEGGSGAPKRLPGRTDSFRLTDRRPDLDPMPAGAPSGSDGGVVGGPAANKAALALAADAAAAEQQHRAITDDMRFDSFQEIYIPPEGNDAMSPSQVQYTHKLAAAAAAAEAKKAAGAGESKAPQARAPTDTEGQDLVSALVAAASMVPEAAPVRGVHGGGVGGGGVYGGSGGFSASVLNMSGVHHVSDRDIEHHAEGEEEADPRPNEKGDECDHEHGEDYIKPTELYELKVSSVVGKVAGTGPHTVTRTEACWHTR